MSDPSPGPEIVYPCRWTYQVIGTDESMMRTAIESILATLEFEIALTNQSRTGKYQSLRVNVIVANDEERHRIFHELRDHDQVRMVL